MNNLFRGRSLINILLLSLGFTVLFFLIIIVLFIPTGKSYKKVHKAYVKEMIKLDDKQMIHDETKDKLQNLQSKNRSYIMAYENKFNAQSFNTLYSKYFVKLTLTQQQKLQNEDIFDVYEVNTTSNLHSPTDFYEFLTAVKKSENIIRVEFPINFIAKNNMLYASFRMKVYGANFDNYKPVDTNTTEDAKDSEPSHPKSTKGKK